jgi:hypothetical protein
LLCSLAIRDAIEPRNVLGVSSLLFTAPLHGQQAASAGAAAFLADDYETAARWT